MHTEIRRFVKTLNFNRSTDTPVRENAEVVQRMFGTAPALFVSMVKWRIVIRHFVETQNGNSSDTPVMLISLITKLLRVRF